MPLAKAPMVPHSSIRSTPISSNLLGWSAFSRLRLALSGPRGRSATTCSELSDPERNRDRHPNRHLQIAVVSRRELHRSADLLRGLVELPVPAPFVDLRVVDDAVLVDVQPHLDGSPDARVAENGRILADERALY